MELNNVEKETKMPDSRFEPDDPFSETEIQAIERALGRDLPEDYRQFVKEYGGAFVGGYVDGKDDFSVLAFLGADEDGGILFKLGWHSDLREDSLLPIADCELGNLYVLTKQNSVGFINYYEGKHTIEKVAESFQDFVDRIVVIED
ncbi:SMI1/KNR4 family protein [Luteolibacter sp. Populi]|uniref:SMI1/KNR4 family protein n=1 Tax=Luteolibacter sp. Populi TaxID=3230487 RepID=UPI003465CDB2